MINRDDVKWVKLITGEEFIAEVEDLGKGLGGGWLMKNPLVFSAREMEGGKVGVSFDSWIPFLENQEVTLHDAQILFKEPPRSDFLDLYEQQFSKIVLPNKGPIIS